MEAEYPEEEGQNIQLFKFILPPDCVHLSLSIQVLGHKDPTHDNLFELIYNP